MSRYVLKADGISEHIARLYAEGLSLSTIAKRLGISKSSVRRQLIKVNRTKRLK